MNEILSELEGVEFLDIWLKENNDSYISVNKNILDEKIGKLYIDLNSYKNNKQYYDDFIKELISNNNYKTLGIVNGALVNDELISTIIKSKSIKSLKLGMLKKDKYNLDYDTYLKLMLSNLTCINAYTNDEQLKKLEDYDTEFESIEFNPSEFIINKNTNKVLIDSLITKDNHTAIIFEQEGLIYFEEVMNKINNLGMDNEIIIKIKDKKEFNKSTIGIVSNYNNNIILNIKGDNLTVIDYLRYENMLFSMIEPAINFSPFERYIYAYNVAKLFKKYKDNEDDSTLSRNLYKILENDYIVCAGYANLFSDLLDKLNIPNEYIVEAVGKEKEEKLDRGWHARVYSNLVDPKYGIDGFYRADPTWDSSFEVPYWDIEPDYYNHLVFTDRQATYSKSLLWLDLEKTDEIFNITTMEEFYYKVEFLQNKVKLTKKEIVEELIERLNKLDSKFVSQLKQKYNIDSNIDDVLDDLGHFLLTKVNKEVSLDKIMEAVSFIYKQKYNYSDEEREAVIEFIKGLNESRQDKFFDNIKIR